MVVSNATDTSKMTSAATSALSAASRMSESTRRATVSVEWPGLKPDWSDGSKSADCNKLFGNESLQELRYDRQVRNLAVRTSLSGAKTVFLEDWRDKRLFEHQRKVPNSQ